MIFYTFLKGLCTISMNTKSTALIVKKWITYEIKNRLISIVFSMEILNRDATLYLFNLEQNFETKFYFELTKIYFSKNTGNYF
jgi:hypothetical protein